MLRFNVKVTYVVTLRLVTPPVRYSFQDCVRYDKLMKYHVKRMVDEGIRVEEVTDEQKEKVGYPKLRIGETVPHGDVYTLNPFRNSNPRATRTHTSLPFLRQQPVHAAVERMRNKCIYPIKVKNPSWNNFLSYLYEFHVHYCDLEGLTLSQVMARKVLLYICYGTYIDKKKSFPIIRCLHYKTIQGRSRFGKYVPQHFKDFLKAFDKHPEWKVFFDDLGKGDAPIDYLVFIEKGFRSFGSDIHAMGSRAMESKVRWFAVARWRKREAYIALIRYIREHHQYPQWDCYKLETYAERQSLHRTFVVRHLPLSNGESDRLDAHLADASEWSGSPVAQPPPSKRAKQVKPNVVADVVSTNIVKPTVWDVENNCFVPF